MERNGLVSLSQRFGLLVAWTELFPELDYLTTAPAHQNKGVGYLLVQSGLQQADAVGANVLVMASTNRGRKLYERCGFKHVSTVVQDDSKWGGSATGSVNHWYTRRQPNSEASQTSAKG